MAINLVSVTTLLSSSILLLLIASGSSTSRFGSPASSGNVLKSGEVLSTEKSLTIGNYTFIMQKDCNLVLYENQNALWDSRTQQKGDNCSLVLHSNGDLQIFSELAASVWRTETIGEYGKYALVLQPNGNAVIYSSSIWSTGTTHTQSQTINAPPRNSVSQNP